MALEDKWALPVAKAAEYLTKVNVEFDDFTMDFENPASLTGARITFYQVDAAMLFNDVPKESPEYVTKPDLYSVDKDAEGKFTNAKPLPDDPPKELTDKLVQKEPKP